MGRYCGWRPGFSEREPAPSERFLNAGLLERDGFRVLRRFRPQSERKPDIALERFREKPGLVLAGGMIWGASDLRWAGGERVLVDRDVRRNLCGIGLHCDSVRVRRVPDRTQDRTPSDFVPERLCTRATLYPNDLIPKRLDTPSDHDNRNPRLGAFQGKHPKTNTQSKPPRLLTSGLE